MNFSTAQVAEFSEQAEGIMYGSRTDHAVLTEDEPKIVYTRDVFQLAYLIDNNATLLADNISFISQHMEYNIISSSHLV